jgi:hypothetical protein
VRLAARAKRTTREIADRTGWSHPTIVNDLKMVKTDQKAVKSDQSPAANSTTTRTAKLTGWDHSTIANDLRVEKSTLRVEKSTFRLWRRAQCVGPSATRTPFFGSPT